jgi:hypothetical protein
MSLGQVVFGIIIVGVLVAVISYGWTQRGVRRNVDGSYIP